ncbi:MAG: hypothetical protein LBD47_10415 [Treponema sp.]|jgi:hypothetical protein|nr:hypothetical protein [Treponema sp.]
MTRRLPLLWTSTACFKVFSHVFLFVCGKANADALSFLKKRLVTAMLGLV